MRISEYVDLYIIMFWIEIQIFIDKFIFRTYWCSEHGYECHDRCLVMIIGSKKIYKDSHIPYNVRFGEMKKCLVYL